MVKRLIQASRSPVKQPESQTEKAQERAKRSRSREGRSALHEKIRNESALQIRKLDFQSPNDLLALGLGQFQQLAREARSFGSGDLHQEELFALGQDDVLRHFPLAR